MFNVGDLLTYSTHGICQVDDICEKTIAGVTREYYILRPIENDEQLTISAPVDNKKLLHKLINEEEALTILESFKYEGIEWNENANGRFNAFNKIVTTGEKQQVADVVNTLMRKENEYRELERKLHQRDYQLLNETQDTLFKEMALSLNTTFEAIYKKVEETIQTYKLA